MTVATHMPPWLEKRRGELCVAARECYALRNAAEHNGDLDRGLSLHVIGDVYFARATAILAEWEA